MERILRGLSNIGYMIRRLFDLILYAVKHAILAKMVEVSGIYRAGWNQWSFIVNYYTRIILLILVYILRKMGCITSDYGTEAKKPYA